jgi:hypothetical protein
MPEPTARVRMPFTLAYLETTPGTRNSPPVPAVYLQVVDTVEQRTLNTFTLTPEGAEELAQGLVDAAARARASMTPGPPQTPFALPVGDVAALADGAALEITGRISALDPQRTTHGDPWTLLTLTDDTGTTTVTVFPTLYAEISTSLMEGAQVTIGGRFNAVAGGVYAQRVVRRG